MGRVDVRVFDMVGGLPAEGMRVDLMLYKLARPAVEIARRQNKTETLWSFMLTKNKPVHLSSLDTNEDGRGEEPLMSGESLIKGHYAVVLHVKKFYQARNAELLRPVLFEPVQVMFAVSDEDDDHLVDLSVSPYGYTVRQGP